MKVGLNDNTDYSVSHHSHSFVTIFSLIEIKRSLAYVNKLIIKTVFNQYDMRNNNFAFYLAFVFGDC